MRKEKLGNLLRGLLIICLLVSAALLARETGYYSRMFDRVSVKAAETEASPGEQTGLSAAELVQAVKPRTVLVRTADGTAMVSAYDGDNTEDAFHRFSAILGEALGSAGEPEHMEEKDFRGGLNGESVYLEFFCEVPLSLLAQWLGSEAHGDAAQMSAHGLYLGISDVNVNLCYRGTDGSFYGCTTAAVSESLRTKMSEFQGASAQFAYDDASLGSPDPYLVVLSALPEISNVSTASVRSSVDTAELMQTLGMNSYLASSYVEADGTKVFIDNEKSLRISADGKVSFRTGGAESDRQPADSLSDAVGYAYEIAKRSLGSYIGDAELLLKSIAAGGTGDYTVTFDFGINGIPLRPVEGNAAEIVFLNGQVVQVTLMLRSYSCTEQTETVLPMQQAAAIAAAAGSTPELVYADDGETVQCVWVKN